MQSDNSSRSHRLPVNPRRHKVAPENRKRVATACNACNVRRTKCSGEQPCRQCAAGSRDCVYPSISPKVSVPRDELQELRRQLKSYEKLLEDTVTDPERRQELLATHSISTPSASSPLPKVPTLSPERTETASTTEADLLGQPVIESCLLHDSVRTARFQGESSDGAFVEDLGAFLRNCLPADISSTIPCTSDRFQSSDHRPLPSFDTSPLSLPPSEVTRSMLSVLSSFIQDGPSEQALQSGGIYWWGNLHGQPSLPSPSGSVEIDIRSMRRLAFYQIALAVACRVASSKPGMPGTSPDRSEPFFSRAVALLGNPLDASHSSIGAVSVLNLMAFYLLQSDRPEASALYIGVAARSVLSLGAHRGHVDERGKRVFWTLYILDRELSCLLGRPPAIPDHAITLSMPAEVDGMPSPAGLCAHVELSRVSERITSTLGPSDGPLYDAEKSLALLDKWQSKLPAHLRLSTEGVSDDSATCNLHMLAIHLVVLSHRPALIGAVKAFNLSAASTCTLSPSEKDSCKSSALHIMRLARHTATLHQPRRLLRSALRFVFSSALCLVVLSMLGADDDAESAYEIEFAKGLFDREAQSGNTYGQSCAATLRELQALAAQVKGEATAMELEQAIESHLVPTSSWHGMSLFSEDAMGLDTMTALENDVLSWMDQEDNL